MPEPEWGPDIVRMREQIYSLIPFSGAGSIVDLGCGYGYDLIRFGEHCGAAVRLVGIDSAKKPVESARKKTTNDPRFTFVRGDVRSGLPFADESFDSVFSINLLECVKDKDALVSEIYRILRPGGRGIVGHVDWDSQILNGTDKPLIRRIVAA